MQPEDIDKLFRDKLQHHAPTPPNHLWAQLEEELQPAKKRPVMWLYAAAAVITLLLVAGAGWLLRGPSLGNSTGELATATTTQPREKKSAKQPTPQATAPSKATSKESEAGSEKLAVAASKGQAPAVHAVRPLAPAPGLRRAVARVTPPARPSTPNSLNPRTAPAQAVAVVAPAVAQPERLALAPTPTPKPESPTTPALVAAAAPTGPIIVEVRRDNAAPGATAFAADDDTGRRKNLGSLLVKAGKKVGNVVLDGRQINLPKVALPEIITAQVEAYTTAPRP